MGANITDPTQPEPTAPGSITSPIVSPVRGVPTSSPYELPKTGAIANQSAMEPLIQASLRSFGIDLAQPDPYNTQLVNRPDPFAELVARTAKKTPLPGMPDVSREAFSLGTGGPLPFSINRAVEAFGAGVSESPLGSLTRFLQMREGANYEYEPGYDIFKDPQISNAGLTNQMHLFYGSQSPARSKWIIQRVQEKAAVAEHLERMGAGAAVAEMIGGLLGDPLTYLPGTLGVKGASLALKAAKGTLTGAEIKLISSPLRTLYGSIGDGIKYAGVTGALMVAQRALENSVDPTMSIEEVTDSLFLPMALAGSMALLTGAFSRRTAKGIAERVKDPDFLKGTPSSGARYVPDDFVGPVIHPSDEAAAGLVSRYDDAATKARRMATGETEFTPKTPTGERVPLPGDIDYRPSEKHPKQTDMPFNGLARDGDLPAGSLATNYGPLRNEEAMRDPATSAILGQNLRGFADPPGQPRTVVDQVSKPAGVGRLEHELPADASGARELVLNGQSRSAAEFETGHRMITPTGDVLRVEEVNGVKRFVREEQPQPTGDLTLVGASRPGKEVDSAGRPYTTGDTETRGHRVLELDPPGEGARRLSAKDLPIGTEAVDYDGVRWKIGLRASDVAGEPKHSLWNFVSDNPKPREGPTSLLDREFKPGELPKAHPVTESGLLAADGVQALERQNVIRLPADPHYPVDATGRPITPPGVDNRSRTNFYGQHDEASKASSYEIGQRVMNTDGTIWTVAMREGEKHFVNPEFNYAPKAAREARGAVDMEFKPGELPAGEEGSVGAALSPQSQVYQREVLLAQGRMAPTGIGLEKLPLDPVARVFMGLSVAAMRVVSDLVSTGGRLTRGNLQGIGGLPPLEQLIQFNWEPILIKAVRGTKDDWAELRHSVGTASGQTGPSTVDFSGRSDWTRLMTELGDALKRKFVRGEPGLSYEEYLRRLAEAINNGDVDDVADSASPYIERSAARHREVYEHTKKRMIEEGVFDEAHKEAVFDAYSEVRAIKKEADQVKARSLIERWDPTRARLAEEALLARMEDAEFKAKQLEGKLDDLHANGPHLNGTAPSYRPRLWDTGKLRDGEERFVSEIVVPWLMTKSQGILDVQEASRIAKQMHGLLSKQNPVYERADVAQLFKSVAAPGSAMARTFAIPDKLVEEFLVNDAEVLLRYHVKQSGTAVEFMRRFKSLDLKDEIAEIEQEYRGLIIEANKGATEPTPEAIRLTKMMKGAIEDVQALRDKLYGTYGAAADPHAWSSRTIRMAKQFTNITLMGMSGVSSLGDFMRPLMTEGLEAMYGYGFRTLMSDSRGIILKMAKQDIELAATGTDLMNNVRAMQAADTGDIFGSRGRIEHGLEKANSWTFVFNGLNQITEWSKNWANVIIQGRMNNVLLDWGQGLPIADADRALMASLAIEEPMARRIALQLKIYGKSFGNGTTDLHLANLGKWQDELAAEYYKSALNQSVNRTVVTPGVGDRPNWMSTEVGSLIGMYKSWAVANLVRSLQSGLQEGGNKFWYGAAGAVGFAVILNELRSQLFYDRSSFDRPLTAVIADGVDRSSILGWFSDANRAVETLTGNRLGVKPMLGAVQAHPVNYAQAAGSVGGPAAGQAFRAGSVVNDFIQGHPTSKTFNNWRTLMPWQNMPFLDPVYDRLISDGNFRKGMDRSRQMQQQRGA